MSVFTSIIYYKIRYTNAQKIYTHTHVYTYIYIYIYIYTYIYIYKIYIKYIYE